MSCERGLTRRPLSSLSGRGLSPSDMSSPRGLLPPSVLTVTAQPAILSELLCILGAEGCVVYVSRVDIHMRCYDGSPDFLPLSDLNPCGLRRMYRYPMPPPLWPWVVVVVPPPGPSPRKPSPFGPGLLFSCTAVLKSSDIFILLHSCAQEL